MTTDRRSAGIRGLSVRTRIAVSVAVLTGLALSGAGLLVYALESARIERGVSNQVEQELAEFTRSATRASTPRRGRSRVSTISGC